MCILNIYIIEDYLKGLSHSTPWLKKFNYMDINHNNMRKKQSLKKKKKNNTLSLCLYYVKQFILDHDTGVWVMKNQNDFYDCGNVAVGKING